MCVCVGGNKKRHTFSDTYLLVSGYFSVFHTSKEKRTEQFSFEVKNVAELMEQVVELINASVEHANTSSEDLKEVVDTTNKMEKLSAFHTLHV